jgi:magnesium-transporting ATPase (P-type)
MGRSGTDVAREAADLVITDDNFATIVTGVEEGRVAYDNVRKVTYLLVSTGAGEVVAVLGALVLGLGIPFSAVQLLWLNLVTNGIQGVALAFEAGEPGVLDRKVRPTGQGLFDRIMVERTVLAVLVFGGVAIAAWASWIDAGLSTEAARSRMVQLFVLFELLHIGNARSERISLLRLSPRRNLVLLLGTLGALGVHLAALHLPFLQRLLQISPPSLAEWGSLVLLAAPIIVVMELHKEWRRRRPLA